jgi:hypothetical protein
MGASLEIAATRGEAVVLQFATAKLHGDYPDDQQQLLRQRYDGAR